MFQGQVYKGQQGTGFATTFNLKSPEYLRQLGEQKAAQGAKERAGAMADMEKVAPGETWHYFQGAITKAYEDWRWKGADIMTRKGINDPWKSADPDAIAWQIEGSRIKAANENIKQYQAEFLKSQDDIRTRGKEYTNEYLESVNQFPLQYSFDQLASGQIPFPQAEFKAPTNYYNGFVRGLTDKLKADYKDKVPTDNQILSAMGDFLSDPDNETFGKTAKQIYTDLSPDKQKEYQALAELQRLGEGWQAVAFTQLKRQFVKPKLSLGEELDKMAKRFGYETSSRSSEDKSGVTVSKSSKVLADKNQPKVEARSFFAENPDVLDDIEFMAALGVDGQDGSFKMTRPERKQAAVKAMESTLRNRAETAFSSSLSRTNGGPGDEETKASFDNWWNDMTQGDAVLAENAARYAFATKGESGLGQATDVKIAPQGPYAQGFAKALQLTYADEKAADKARLELAKELKDSEEGKSWLVTNFPGIQPTEDQVVNELKRQSSSTVVNYPLSLINKQTLEKKYNQIIKETGKVYERQVTPDPAGLFRTAPVATKPKYE